MKWVCVGLSLFAVAGMLTHYWVEHSTSQAETQDAGCLTNSLGMKLVRIEPGSFVMGEGAAPPATRAEWEQRDWDEAPAHTVKISTAFYLGCHEVTNAEFEQFAPAHKQLRLAKFGSTTDEEPVVMVTWQQAVAFCDWLSKKEGRTYRLPTEAEWEYACRAGTATAFHTGANLAAADANIGKDRAAKPLVRARPVGSYAANAWGLHDMHGNVAEWCQDWYGPYEPGAQPDPTGRASGYARVVRGWSYLSPSFKRDPTRYHRAANRAGHLPEDANRYTGFRVALGEAPQTKPLPEVRARHQQDVLQTPAPKTGPDPTKPYYVDYKKNGTQPTIPKDTWGPIFSNWNHFAACCVCPNGDVLAAWYSTVSESGRELVVAASRLRAGAERWEPVSLFFDVPDHNDHAPVLLSDGKRLYFFCTQSFAGWDYASDIMRTSDDNGATWSHPQIVVKRDDPLPLSQPCTALINKEGVLVVACDGDNHRDERVLTSRDGGKSWQVGKGDMRKSAGGRYVIHPAIVELRDGSLLTFLRGPHPMPVAQSRDLGETWEVRDSAFPGIGTGQKPSALRLATGGILLCSHDNKRDLVGGGAFAAVSYDEGKSYAHVRKLEGVGGYMAVTQAPNGVIYVVGTQMGCAAFNETWLKEGAPIQ